MINLDNRETKIEYDYPMIIFGKERIIPYLNLVQSPFESKKWSLTMEEHQRVSMIIISRILESNEVLTTEEVEGMRSFFKLSSHEVTTVVSRPEIKAAVITKENSQKLKIFFKRKLMGTRV